MAILSPRKANTRVKLNSLKRDNKAFGDCDILVDETTVSIWPDSKITSGWISLSKKDFNRMIDWYNSEQKIRS